jgi:hypothetical protein
MKKKLPDPGLQRVQAMICGEIDPTTIPVAPGIDLEALKGDDADPLQVVVEIPSGKSKRGWDYTPEALTAIVEKANAQGLPGYEGHMKPEEVNNKFPQPVTHWVGGVMKDGKAYLRGLVDSSAKDLKRWIKAGTIKTTSIFGTPQLKQTNEGVKVVGYDAISNDWTPLGRAGMPTKIVYAGEMVDVVGEQWQGEMEGSFEQLREDIRTALREKLGSKTDVYIQETFDDQVIVETYAQTQSGEGMSVKYYSYPYGTVEGKIQFGEPTEVKRVIEYKPVGEMEDKPMTLEELLAALKGKVTAGEATNESIAQELGIQIAPASNGEMDAITAALAPLGEMAPAEAITLAVTAWKAQEDAKREVLVDTAIKAKVTGEMAQALVRKMLTGKSATEEQIAGEIDGILADETIKGVISKMYTEGPAPKGSGKEGNSSLVAKKATV